MLYYEKGPSLCLVSSPNLHSYSHFVHSSQTPTSFHPHPLLFSALHSNSRATPFPAQLISSRLYSWPVSFSDGKCIERRAFISGSFGSKSKATRRFASDTLYLTLFGPGCVYYDGLSSPFSSMAFFRRRLLSSPGRSLSPPEKL